MAFPLMTFFFLPLLWLVPLQMFETPKLFQNALAENKVLKKLNESALVENFGGGLLRNFANIFHELVLQKLSGVYRKIRTFPGINRKFAYYSVTKWQIGVRMVLEVVMHHIYSSGDDALHRGVGSDCRFCTRPTMLRKVGGLVTQIRGYRVLAIESSCDDTCIALLERSNGNVKVVQHIKKTLNSTEEGGIIPTKAFDHHQQSISGITQQIIRNHGLDNSPPDIICATRGPGMKGSLSIGLDFAKGLSVAWGKPLIGVHHMLGHLLTPRFESSGSSPEFPFLTLLISGGHTMLVLSHNLLDHEVLCNTLDVACGDALDKCSRELGLKGNNLGRELEHYVQCSKDNWETYQWEIPKPLYNKRGRVDQIAFAFGSFQGYIKKLKDKTDLDEDMRQSLAYQVQKGIFDHLITKINLTMEKNYDKLQGVKSFVGSGGVASNMFLRSMLDTNFNEKGIKTSYPSLELCTDNAVMIGWAGIELHEKGLSTELDVCPISRWPLGEIMDAPGWKKAT